MKPYLALYWKELKTLIVPFSILLIVYVLNILSILFTDFAAVFEKGYIVKEYYTLKEMFLFWSIFVLPGLLLYSIYDEWNTGTSHQLLSLPVSRYSVILCKFLAVMTTAIVVVFVITAGNYIFEQKVFELFPLRFHVSNQTLYALNMFASIMWLLGIASLTGAVVYAVKRHRLFYGIVLSIGMYKVSGKVIIAVKKALEHRLFGQYSWSYLPGMRMHENDYITLLNGLYPLILGGLFLVMGLYIFKQYIDI